LAILKALQANPVTAPYRIAVTARGKQYVLSGTVGSTQIHDAAIQTVIALGYPVADNLTVDTAEAHRVAAQALGTPVASPYGFISSGAYPYIYPPPLFGRLDDPFFGFEPPLISYPPWWGGVAARPMRDRVAQGASGSPTAQAQGPGAGGGAPAAAPAIGQPLSAPAQIELTIDTAGTALLRGVAATLADRVAIGQEVARIPGITDVVNELQVSGSNPAASSDTPPPPPVPAVPQGPSAKVPGAPRSAVEPPREPAAAQGAPISVDQEPLSRRVSEAIARRPALVAAPIKVTAGDGVVTLSGHVPTAYEAMLAFRAAEQTPGVRELIDRLEFALPNADGPSPLRDKARAEDLEPYLLAQLRRQVGSVAHVDQVRVHGDTLEIRGTVSRDDDKARVEATLRSIPLLRGFRLEPTFLAD
jgi:osmotically-inducible protein OsmY